MTVDPSEIAYARDLPADLFASVSRRLSHYTIAFLKITPAKDGEDAELLGSGVLVKTDTVHEHQFMASPPPLGAQGAEVVAVALRKISQRRA